MINPTEKLTLKSGPAKEESSPTPKASPEVVIKSTKVTPLETGPGFKEWCLSEERLNNLKKELDKRMAAIKPQVPDVAYRIDLEDNTINFLGGPEKAVCTSLIQRDSAILNLFTTKRLYYTREYKQSVAERMDKLEKLFGNHPDKLDKLIAALEKSDAE